MINLLGSVVRQGLELLILPLPPKVTGHGLGSTQYQGPDLRTGRTNLRKGHQLKGQQLWVGKVTDHFWVWSKLLPLRVGVPRVLSPAICHLSG